MKDAAQDAVIAFLGDPATHGLSGRVETIDTHISKVFLAGDRAYKLKRAVLLPYTDASTPEKRLANCRKEFELNRRTAPDLYLGVRRITRARDGQPRFDGDGPLLDAVVEMVRFDQDALFDRMAERDALTPELMRELADIVARYHAEAPVADVGRGSENIAAVLDINLKGFHTSDVFAEADIERLDAAFRRELERHRRALDAREAAGLVRRCHGDLHLRNICLFKGRPTLFDCIEFSDQLATVDVLYDLAFLLMDLWHRNLPRFANLVANSYFDAIDTDDGYALLPFFMALRAAVRAHVTATFAMDAGDDRTGQVSAARRYFDLGEALLKACPARVLAIGGLSGSGKSTVAEAAAPLVGAAPGARLLESDRQRKALFGEASEARLPQAAYGSDVSDKVYGLLSARAAALAEAGASVIVNAVYDRADRRHALEEAVKGHDFSGVWLRAAPDTLRTRLRQRPKGASDATLDILEAQLVRDPGPMTWSEVSSEGGVEATVDAALDAAGIGAQRSSSTRE
jgi:hypothetical protein